MSESLLIDKTTGLCPHCLIQVDAELVGEDGRVFLDKHCGHHGRTRLMVSTRMDYYQDLRDLYFLTHREVFTQTRYLLFMTPKCNLACPGCFLSHSEGQQAVVGVEDVLGLSDKGKRELILFGAEPTCHPDLFRMIVELKKTQFSVSVYTNGISSQDRGFVAELRKTGVDKVYFQFDGFSESAYEVLRGGRLLAGKLKSLENLRDFGIPVVLDVTVARSVNEEEVGSIFDYCLRNSFINTINYIAYVRAGAGRDYLSEGYLMPEEIMDILVRHADGRISREGIYVFQKLLYLYMSLLKRRTCFYIQYYWVYRETDKEFVAFEEIFHCSRLNSLLDTYSMLLRKFGRWIAMGYLLLWAPISFLLVKRFSVFLRMVRMASSHVLRRGEYASSSPQFLQLIFTTACDPAKSDSNITERCHVGMIYKRPDGSFEVNDHNGKYLLNKEILLTRKE